MAPTPGGGLPLYRYFLLSAAVAGTGLQDACLLVFLIETLRKFNATRFVAFLPIALGGLISIPFAAVMNSLGARGVRWRQTTAILCLYAAALFSIALAYSLRKGRGRYNLIYSISMATLYRACSQSSPIVPMLHDSARVFGSEVDTMRRRLIATSTIYVWYRLGFTVTAVVIAVSPSTMLDDLFYILISTAGGALVLTTISALSTHGDPTRDPQSSSMHASLRGSVKDHFNAAVFKADRRLLAAYIEMVAYGLAFGQLGSVTASFYNDQVFKSQPGSVNALRWATFASLSFNAINYILDAILPIIVFRMNARKFSMPVAWVGGALIGTGVFIGLKFAVFRVQALLLFSALALTTSTHNLFSLLAAGAYVEPRLRGTVFGVRAAAGSTGTFIGAFVGGAIAQATNGFDWVMLFCAFGVCISGIAAAFGGTATEDAVDGVAVNANPLIKYLLHG